MLVNLFITSCSKEVYMTYVHFLPNPRGMEHYERHIFIYDIMKTFFIFCGF